VAAPPTRRAAAQTPYPRGASEAKVLALFGERSSACSFGVGRSSTRRILIIERGWWDLAVDPARYRLRPMRLVRRWVDCCRRSDLWSCSKAARAAATRKDECSEEELAASRRVAQRRAAPCTTLYLDVSLALDEVVSLATEEVLRLAPSLSRRNM
jgi:hypothetical protein